MSYNSEVRNEVKCFPFQNQNYNFLIIKPFDGQFFSSIHTAQVHT